MKFNASIQDILDSYLWNLLLGRVLILTTKHKIFRRCSHSSNLYISVLVEKFRWMRAEFGDMLPDDPSPEVQNLAPKIDVKIAPQQIRGDVCANDRTFLRSGYLHGQLCKSWVCLGIHASKCFM